jgi:hypothetical protein
MARENRTKSEDKMVEEEPEMEIEISAPDYAFDDRDAPWLTDNPYYGSEDTEDSERRSSQQYWYGNEDTPYDLAADTSFGTPEPSAEPITPPKDDWSPHY